MRLLVSGSTATVRRLAGRFPDHLGHLLTPRGWNALAPVLRSGLPWALDNGAYSGFDRDRFVRLLDLAAGKPRCLFVVAPDVVADARATLALWPWWSVLIRSRGLPVAFVLQDGQESLDLPDADAYFLGGSTAWKLSQASADLCDLVRCAGKYLHMGRVNTRRRMRAAWSRRCDSFDGSIFSRMDRKFLEKGLSWLAQVEREPDLFPAPSGSSAGPASAPSASGAG